LEDEMVRRRQVFVSGTWSAEKAAPYASDARRLGVLIAESGYDLATGPGTGIAGLVIDGFRSVKTSGRVRFYLPAREAMERVGEAIERTADETVETTFDYPMRNVFQVSESAGLFVITGGDGTLEEILPALIDYNLPVAVVADSGNAARAVSLLANALFPEWKKLLNISDDVTSLFSWLVMQMRAAK
jgi:predicted Rossmann-fold nucleotide-binding protein